jgi:DNA polymerase-3 subunit delta
LSAAPLKAGSVKVRELKAELASKPRPCYLVAGEDAYVRQQAQRAFVELIPPDLRCFNLNIVSASSLEPATLFTELDMLPLGCDYRVCLITDWENAGKELQEAVGSYLDRANPALVLGLFSARKPDLRFKLTNRLKTGGLLVECNTPKPSEIAGFLRTYIAKDKNYELPLELAELVVDRCGNDLGASVQAVLAMMDHAGERTVLGREDLALVAGNVDYKTTTDMTNYIGKKQPAKALVLARKVLEDKAGEPEKMVGLLERHLRLLAVTKAHHLAAPGELAKRLGVNPYFVKDYTAQVKNFTLGKLEKMLLGLGKVDMGNKTSTMDIRQGLELFILDACRK